MSQIYNEDHRFGIQKISEEEWIRTSVANAAIDYHAGYLDVVHTFLDSREEPEFAALKRRLESLTMEELDSFIEEQKTNSLQFLVLMLTGSCNADCKICFTNRRKKDNELNHSQRARLLREAKQLGAKFVYIPGEGEPTIDPGFWDLLDECKDVGLHAIIFTNGIILSDPSTCRRYWNMDIDEAVCKLKSYPVSFYFKLWSTDENLAGEMMEIDSQILHYNTFEDIKIPNGLITLLNHFPGDRIGVEVIVEKRNYTDVLNTIIPFTEQKGIPRIVEMIQHNGRIFGDVSYDLNDEQLEAIMPLLSPTSCAMATCKAVITSQGYLSPRIAILEEQLPSPPVNIADHSLYTLLHNTTYVVERRYDIVNCLCEQYAVDMAMNGNQGFVPLSAINVIPTL